MSVYEDLIRPILDAAAEQGAERVTMFAPEPTGQTYLLQGTYATANRQVLCMEDAPPVTSDDADAFLREVGLELPVRYQASVDGQLGESVRFQARRSGNRSLDISFRHLRNIPRTVGTGNSSSGPAAAGNPIPERPLNAVIEYPEILTLDDLQALPIGAVVMMDPGTSASPVMWSRVGKLWYALDPLAPLGARDEATTFQLYRRTLLDGRTRKLALVWMPAMADSVLPTGPVTLAPEVTGRSSMTAAALHTFARTIEKLPGR
ncbi:hypothetical protein [Arthrobacter caoxuetaonis]|uniref:Uncharacterized protein n=1 Tax=Arthrobacter caoxuetaonis TaxID=2886935 RepID=A0A9X1MFY8_9MICC|nr:hypothetical protein [Arthrobacter caoxuetaonis]MCC3299379.1 hypothetical protein [Arthrobacter caoxuetaonis]USQ59128.1 hypothetical protein NF551_18655 [Arthrobacter caoxuetaonis]